MTSQSNTKRSLVVIHTALLDILDTEASFLNSIIESDKALILIDHEEELLVWKYVMDDFGSTKTSYVAKATKLGTNDITEQFLKASMKLAQNNAYYALSTVIDYETAYKTDLSIREFRAQFYPTYTIENG